MIAKNQCPHCLRRFKRPQSLGMHLKWSRKRGVCKAAGAA